MIQIRKARSEDFALIWPMLRDVFRAGDTYAVDPDIDEANAKDYWMTQAVATYIAEGQEGVVGTYYIKTNQPGGGAHVCNCGYVVDLRARGRGVAKALCVHSQSEALALGYLAMQFNFVLSSNTGALRLWRQLGFDTVGTIPEAFDHPVVGMVDAHVMYKLLT